MTEGTKAYVDKAKYEGIKSAQATLFQDNPDSEKNGLGNAAGTHNPQVGLSLT
jgi:hypothetical protein